MMCSRQIVTRVKNFVIVGHSFRFPSLDRNHDVRGAIPREPYRCESAGKASPAAFTSLLSTFKNSDYDPFSGGWFQHLAFVNSSLFGALPIRTQFFEFRDESSFSIVDRNSQLGAMPPWLIRFLSRFAQNLGGLTSLSPQCCFANTAVSLWVSFLVAEKWSSTTGNRVHPWAWRLWKCQRIIPSVPINRVTRLRSLLNICRLI